MLSKYDNEIRPLSCRVNYPRVSILLSSMLIVIAAITVYPNSISGQTISSDRTTTQSWIDQKNNIKIQFTYSPEKPIIYKPIQLKFDVQNLQTGSHLKNLTARVVIVTNSTGQERSFKFTSITAPDGIFSIKQIFPEWGVYQVICRIYSEDVSVLASFKVLVPIQPVGIISTNYLNSLLLPAGLVGIIGAVFILIFIIMMKKESK